MTVENIVAIELTDRPAQKIPDSGELLVFIVVVHEKP